MKIIGLTGGIASGKNFIADIFEEKGAAVFDADKEVHKLLESDKLSFNEVKENFPEAVINQKIDRKILGKIVFNDEKKLAILEKIIHPKIREAYKNFLKEAQKNNKKLAVLNIPLLLESEGYNCDKIVAIIAPKLLRKKRFLQRSKKSDPKNFNKILLEKRFEQIFAKQISDIEREKNADFVIKNNDSSKQELSFQVDDILANL